MTIKLHGDITINGKYYPKGSDISGYLVYPFFLFCMLMFGTGVFLLAYALAAPPILLVLFLYLWGGISICAFLLTYIAIFGVDEVKWAFLNAAVGFTTVFGLIDMLLSIFGRSVHDYPFYLHIIPILYVVLYTFLIRQAVLDISNSRDITYKKQIAENACMVIFIIYLLYHYLF